MDWCCKTKHICNCTFLVGGHLKGNIAPFPVFKLHHSQNQYLSSSSPKLKTVIRHRKKMGDSLWSPKTHFCSLSSFIVTVWWIPCWKMSPDPRENKTLWTVSSFFQLSVCVQQSCTSVWHPRLKTRTNALCLVSGRKRAEQLHSPNFFYNIWEFLSSNMCSNSLLSLKDIKSRANVVVVRPAMGTTCVWM